MKFARPTIAAVSLLFLLARFAASCHAQAYPYTLTDVGALDPAYPLQAEGISSNGDIAIQEFDPSTDNAGTAIYSNGAITVQQGSFALYTLVFGINSSEQMTGSIGGQFQAFLYSGGEFVPLGYLGVPTNGTPALSVGEAINDAGQVAGGSTTSGGSYHAFLYSGGQMTDLGVLGVPSGGTATSGASAINRYGDVAGLSTTSSGATDVFLYKNGVMTDVSPLGYTAYSVGGINSSDVICSYGYTIANGIEAYIIADGVATPVGSNPPQYAAQPSGIDDAGDVVGTSPDWQSDLTYAAFSGTEEYLDYLDGFPTPPYNYSTAVGFDDAGDIAGTATDPSGNETVYLLTRNTGAIGLAYVSPTQVSAGTGTSGASLDLYGLGYTKGAKVYFGKAALPTKLDSQAHLTATIPGSLLTSPRNVDVTVQSGGAVSAERLVSVVSQIESIYPTSVYTQTAFALTVDGAGFAPGAQIDVNGKVLRTTGTRTQLQCTVPASVIPGMPTSGQNYVTVSVINPNGVGSTNQNLTVIETTPSIESVRPATIDHGQPYTLTVTGTAFDWSSRLMIGSVALDTTVMSSTLLKAQIAGVQDSTAGPLSVYVSNSGPTNSAPYQVTVSPDNPPAIANPIVNPIIDGFGGPITVYVVSPNAVQGAFVTFDGHAMTTTPGNTLTATGPPSLMPGPGTARIRVVNPGPGGGSANAVTLTLESPAPIALSEVPLRLAAGAPSGVVAYTGVKFAPGITATFSGTAVTVDRISAEKISLEIPGELLATADTSVPVILANPSPSAGTAQQALIIASTTVAIALISVTTDSSTGDYVASLQLTNTGYASTSGLTSYLTLHGANPLSATPTTDLAPGNSETVQFLFKPGAGKAGSQVTAAAEVGFEGDGGEESKTFNVTLP